MATTYAILKWVLSASKRGWDECEHEQHEADPDQPASRRWQRAVGVQDRRVIQAPPRQNQHQDPPEQPRQRNPREPERDDPEEAGHAAVPRRESGVQDMAAVELR